MPLVSHNLFTSSNPRSCYTSSCCISNTLTRVKPQKFLRPFPLKPFSNPFHTHLTNSIYRNNKTHQRISLVSATFDPGNTTQNENDSIQTVNFDSFLSFLEFVSLVSSAVVSVGCVVNYAFWGASKPVLGWLGSRVMAWHWVVLVSGVVAGAVIRRRQWRRICNVDFSQSGGTRRVNLVERIEKLEEDLKSSATIIRVMSRQLEKLGIRFRVTRKALKEPIAETAALAQKNSEATRALAAQEDRLEKELGEIQKVLLAMQEQQQKQLELILAIAKNGKLFESKKEPIQHRRPSDTPTLAADGVAQLELNQIEALAEGNQQ